MRQFVLLFILCGTSALADRPATAQSPPATPSTPTPVATPTPTTAAECHTLYDDPTANTYVPVTPILPNSSTTMMTFGAVKRIRVHQEILIIEWGTTATTLLPRQFVGSLTVQQRAQTLRRIRTNRAHPPQPNTASIPEPPATR